MSPGRRVLVVEDQADARESLRLLLEFWGHQVEVAPDGLRGVQVALAWKPEVAIVDIGLPLLDGYEVARRIRLLPGLEKALLVAITGYGREEDVKRCQGAGIDRHLIKPVDPPELERVLAGAARKGIC